LLYSRGIFMKKKIYSIAIATCLLLTQQTKPFIDPASFGMAVGGFAFNYLQNSVVSAMMVALSRKAQQGAQLAKQINDQILPLRHQLSDLNLPKTAKMTILSQINSLEQKRDKEITLVHKIAGFMAPTIGAVSAVSDVYSKVGGFMGLFGYNLPGVTSIFLNYMSSGK